MAIIQGTSKSSAAAAYEIEQSIRFNDDDSAYLTRTPSSAGDKRTWTFSVWTKRGNLGADRRIFTAASNGTEFFFDANDKLNFYHYSGGFVWRYISTAVFRDCASWYHFLLRVDTTDATAGNRIRVYANGQQINDWDTSTAPSLNAEGFVNGTSAHYIGRYSGGNSNHWDGYLAEINHVDGSSLAPTEFGKTNADTGQWVPVKYTGSYGTNGFYITGADSADLGADDSGNGNDFTSSGLAAADQVTDSPTDNFSTMNALGSGFVVAGSIADGNLQVTTGTAIEGEWYFGTQRLQGNVYWEVYINSIGNSRLWCGVGIDGDDYAHASSDHWMIYSFNGTFYDQGSAGNTSSAISATSTLQFAFSEDNDALWVGVDGTWLYSATQAEIEAFTTTNKANSTSFGGVDLFPVVGTGSSTNVVTYNFGQTAFTHTKPTGYSAVSTANLPDPTIADPSAYFQTTLYTGNASTQEVNQSGNSTFEPGFVWIKTRSNAASHALFDQVRGVNKQIRSDSTGTEYTAYSDLLTAFDADGFTLGADATVNNVNVNAYTYAAWQWAADGTSGSSNTDGSITSTVSADTTSGFSIATYTGNATVGATVGHGLGVAPKMVIVKSRSNAENWIVGHDSIGWTKAAYLNSTSAPFTLDIYWNNTAPTSSVVELHDHVTTNGSGYTYVMYSFAEVEGFSKIGSFTGNGSTTDGPFIYTGFKPEFFMWKRTDSGTYGDWTMMDAARDPFNMVEKNLRANSTMADDTGEADLDFVSNGIKHRGGSSARFNQSGAAYIYMAFASSPFKTATAR